MRILYVALDQQVPGTVGGSVHVRAVAEGLARLGHDVHVLTGAGPEAFPAGTAVRWQALGAPLGLPHLRWVRSGAVRAAALRLRPQVVMERYHNFGGEGLAAAARAGAVSVLEVNAPVIDYPGSLKQRLDRLALVEPMRRWRERQCRMADLLVTPSAAILPPGVPADRILEVEWGADVERFRPGAAGRPAFAREPGAIVAVFAGAFRRWHGAIHLVEATRALRRRGRRDLQTVLIGAGPELDRVRSAAQGLEGIVFTGRIDHEAMPASLAAADIGVAPFDLEAHAPLRLAFYWSPLKVFEYMASGLPVVAPDVERLRDLVRHEREGLLYDPADAEALVRTLERLTDATLRSRLGRAARERAVTAYSWQSHCERLVEAFERKLALRQARSGQAQRAPGSCAS